MRRQVLLLVTAVTVLVLLSFLVPLAVLVRTLAVDRATSAALQEAQGLAVVAAVVTDPEQLAPLVQLADQDSTRAVSVVLPDGRVLGAPVQGASRSLELAGQGRSFTVTSPQGREVFVPVQSAAGRSVVRSFVPEALLYRGVRRALTLLGGLAAVLLLVALLVADRLARGTVGPVTALAQTTRRLAAGDLQARVEPGGPAELRDAGRAVNLLGDRIVDLLAAERDNVADLSHRLRTPLTALRLQAENLSSPEEAATLGAAVEAVEATVSDVIRTARRTLPDAGAHCDAVAVLSARTQFWSVLAEDQGRPWTVELPPGTLPVPVGHDEMAAALDVLFDNAFAHTPEGSPIEVRCFATDEGVALEIADRGEGFAVQAVRRGHSGAGSTGLGLDIARRTAEAAGGRLAVIARPEGGVRVRLVVPAD